MKKSRQSANQTERLVQFRYNDAVRISGAVHAYETSRRGRNPSHLPRASGGAGGGGLVEGTFSGAWPKGQTKEVVLLSDTTGTSTVSAFNYLYSIQPLDTPANYYRKCILMEGGVIAAQNTTDCTLVSAEE